MRTNYVGTRGKLSLNSLRDAARCRRQKADTHAPSSAQKQLGWQQQVHEEL